MKTVEDIIENLEVMSINELTLLGLNIFEETRKRKSSTIELNNEYARRLQQIEKVCDTFADNLQDKKDRRVGMTTMLSYLIHIKQLAGGVVK